MDPTLPVIRLRTMDDVFGEAVSRPRLLAQLLGLFAALALALAAIGTYGILCLFREPASQGDRHPHGARCQPRDGFAHGARAGAGFTVTGLVVGVAAAFGLTRLLQAQLFNVKPTDPATIASVAVFIAFVAMAACLIPANRAARVDPHGGSHDRRVPNAIPKPNSQPPTGRVGWGGWGVGVVGLGVGGGWMMWRTSTA